MNYIACFLTCGYTEAGAMQSFFRKINANYVYKQFLPDKTIKKKGMPKTISNNINGLTGKQLLNKIYDILYKHKEDILSCKAIIIEDDLDGRFHNYSQKKIKQHYDEIKNNIYNILGKNIPIFIIYASPEIESWFFADWDNSFKYVYSNKNYVKDVNKDASLFYLHHLHTYIFNNILGRYSKSIEDYGFNNNTYIKLSDQIIYAMQGVIAGLFKNVKSCNKEYLKQIRYSKDLNYSKKLHGDIMLRQLEPKCVAKNCRKYFKPFYSDLLNLNN